MKINQTVFSWLAQHWNNKFVYRRVVATDEFIANKYRVCADHFAMINARTADVNARDGSRQNAFVCLITVVCSIVLGVF